MAIPTTTNVKRPRALGYSFRLDDLYLRGAISPDRPLDITTAPLEAQKINTANGSEDLRNEFGEIFSRSKFVGGEGLDFAHQRDLPTDAANRYWDSKHIDITNPTPGQPARFTLLQATATIDATANTNLALAYDGTAVYMGSGTTTRRSANPTATTPTFADDGTGSATTIQDLTNLGADIYAAQDAAGIYKRSGGSWAHLASSPAHVLKVWGVKLYLIASTGAGGTILSTIASDGTETVKVTLPTGQSWLDVGDCGPAIIACASDGNIYMLAPDSSNVLVLQSQTPMPNNEVPYCVGWDGNYVFVGTREATPSGAIGRVYRYSYRTTLGGTSFNLTDATLLRQWGNQSTTIDQAPRRIVANRKGVVWGIQESDSSYLWRYSSASAGVSRHLDLGVSATVVDIASVSGRLFATVSGTGVRREKVGTYETTGYLIGPLGDLFNASQKSWSGARIDTDSITSDERIELYYTTDASAITDSTSSSWTRVKNIISSRDDDETPLANVDARFLAGMVKVYASTNQTVTPAVRSFSFRAYPGPGDVQVTMAIDTSDLVTAPNRKSVRSQGLGARVYAELAGKEGRYAELQVLATGEVFRGVVEQVSTRIPQETLHGSPSVVSMVTFRGRRVSFAGVSQSNGAIGIETIGKSFIGGKEF